MPTHKQQGHNGKEPHKNYENDEPTDMQQGYNGLQGARHDDKARDKMQQRTHTQQRDPGTYAVINLFKVMLVIEIHKNRMQEIHWEC